MDKKEVHCLSQIITGSAFKYPTAGIRIHLPPGGRGYVGIRGVVTSAGREVTVTGLIVVSMVSFSPARVAEQKDLKDVHHYCKICDHKQDAIF